MSLLSSIILPKLEKELVAIEPEITKFLLGQLHSLATEVITWAENKMQGATNEVS